MAAPEIQEILTAMLKQAGVETAPADLPIEAQRALIAAIIAQQMGKTDD